MSAYCTATVNNIDQEVVFNPKSKKYFLTIN